MGGGYESLPTFSALFCCQGGFSDPPAASYKELEGGGRVVALNFLVKDL